MKIKTKWVSSSWIEIESKCAFLSIFIVAVLYTPSLSSSLSLPIFLINYTSTTIPFYSLPNIYIRDSEFWVFFHQIPNCFCFFISSSSSTSSNMERVRRASHAGSWYTDNRKSQFSLTSPNKTKHKKLPLFIFIFYLIYFFCLFVCSFVFLLHA